MQKRVDQILPSYTPYDAIGQEAVLIRDMLRRQGLQSDIYAEHGYGKDTVCDIQMFPKTTSQDRVIYHHSTGTQVFYRLHHESAERICRFHNVTPYWFFKPGQDIYHNCLQGYNQLPILQGMFEKFWSASHYSAQLLVDQKCSVIPVCRDYRKLLQMDEDRALQKDLQKVPTLLFVGRLVENKAIHDFFFLISSLRQVLDQKQVRILLVGSGVELQYIQNLLRSLWVDLGLKVSFDRFSMDSDIVVLSQLTEQELATCYRHSKAFVCLSDHEGFGVPLVEAMHFGLPIVAHAGSAVEEVCQGAALLLNKHDPVALVRGCLQALRGQIHKASPEIMKPYGLEHVTQLVLHEACE